MSDRLIDTSCEGCYFAVYNKSSCQIGCQFGRLEKFEKNGATLNFQNKHFVIEGRVCNTRTSPEWVEKHPGNPIHSIREAVKIRYDTIIYSSKGGIEEIRLTVDSLVAQEIQPQNIIIIMTHRKDRPLPQHVVKMMWECPIKWRVENLTMRDSRGKSIDRALAGSKSPWYSLFYAGYQVRSDYFSAIDRLLNDELRRFVVVLPAIDAKGNGVVITRAGHQSAGGNKYGDVVRKLRQEASNLEEKFIVNYEELKFDARET